ncbi:NERD domain-containing protein [Bacillus sp. 03113]|uniref:NERD domain-containing protein n=1 Tax=Bacillus sp. 03113 TaxID=2578211 RepID=UPI00215B905F|nr:NERD domain-containing protein [Bacillus sp. 03113]
MKEFSPTILKYVVKGDDDLIVKKLEIPIHIKKLEAVLKRLPIQHPKYLDIKDKLARQKAGYYGERDLGYYLNFISEQKYFIFHDLRLFNGKNYFQIDILILSPDFFLILEVKNLSGTLLFDTNFDQLIRILNEKENAFENPILQAERHQSQLKNWLKDHKFPNIPIESLVVISNPRTILKSTSNHPAISQKVIHSENLQTRINTFEKRYPNEAISEKDLRKLSRLLLKKHTEFDPNIFKQFNISEKELLKGVYCPNCSFLLMKKIHGSWICPSCQQKSKDAHIAALKDYVLLNGPAITNQEARDFLQLDSSPVATRLFHSMNLTYEGNNKGRVYFLNFDD